MRLSRIEIENFKGIGQRQAIDIKPITLLFGPNSAGKSTVIQALHYAREILERGNCDPDQTIAGGLIDLGGFTSIVHNHELSRTIKLKLTFDLPEGEGHERLPLNGGGEKNEAAFANLHLRYLAGRDYELREDSLIRSFAVAMEVSWSEQLRGPYVSRLAVDLEGSRIAAIRSTAEPGRAEVAEFNFNHPLLWQMIETEDAPAGSDLTRYSAIGSELDQEADPFVSPLAHELWDLSRQLRARSIGLRMAELMEVLDEKATAGDEDAVEAIRTIADEMQENLANLPNQPAATKLPDSRFAMPPLGSEFRVGVTTNVGALPQLDRALVADLMEVDDEEFLYRSNDGTNRQRLSKDDREAAGIELQQEILRRTGLSRVLDELLLGPVRAARDWLTKITYLGPLREIPPRLFRPRLSPDSARWARGLAAWDALHTDKGPLREAVNSWLSSEGRLGTRYSVELQEYVELPVPSRMGSLFDRGITEDDVGELQELYASLSRRRDIALRDDAGLVVSPLDVGIGISQLVPVVVGCLQPQEGLFAIEQPELHIHPAVQVGLGDLFILAATANGPRHLGGKSLLVETHSEHIMLRLLRRVRETTDGELPPGTFPIVHDDLSVVYVESDQSTVSFRQLRVDAEGEFLDRWPKGFFEERAEELF